jgi:DNA-binding CsgD family transcriptional regulator
VEMLLAFVHPDDRDRLASLLEQVVSTPESIPADGVRVEYRVVLHDGSVREMHARGRVEDGRWWFGTVQDVTRERMTERELQAHYAVSQALRDWETFEEGVSDLLRRLSTALDYAMASLWVWDADQEGLTCRAFWSAPGVDPGDFEEAKRTQVFPPGDGKPGLAWQLQQPVITPDMRVDRDFRPREAALQAGILSTVSFPAVGPDGPIAVVSLYSLEMRVPSASLMRTLTGIGRELGRFFSRRRAQFEPRRLSERELEVLALAADGLTGRAIAERLFISPSTIKTHFENIYDKLGVSDRAAAVAQGLRLGLLR